jgi:hypothetical protein
LTYALSSFSFLFELESRVMAICHFDEVA